MRSSHKNTIKKQVVMFLVAIVILVVSIFLVYKNFFRVSTDVYFLLEPETETQLIDYQHSRSIEDFFNDPVLRQFEKHGDWPTQPSRTGKANPFLPYFGD